MHVQVTQSKIKIHRMSPGSILKFKIVRALDKKNQLHGGFVCQDQEMKVRSEIVFLTRKLKLTQTCSIFEIRRVRRPIYNTSSVEIVPTESSNVHLTLSLQVSLRKTCIICRKLMQNQYEGAPLASYLISL